MDASLSPVLIVGGSGVVGSLAAGRLREMYPAVPIAIAGRTLLRAQEVAATLGNARGLAVDLGRRDLGLDPADRFSAVVMFLKDDGFNSLRFAQDRGIPYVGISTAAFEVGPEVAFAIQRPQAAPVLMHSNWLAGTSTLATFAFAREFERIDSVRVSALLDEQDMGGAAAYADYERQIGSGASALRVRDGKWEWVSGPAAAGSFAGVDGRVFDSQLFGNLDVLSIAAGLEVPNVSFEFALGETASRRRGEPFSHEILIGIDGLRSDGGAGSVRHALVHPEGQAPLTALGVVLAVERLLGLAGQPPVQPGLYLPHTLIDPQRAVDQMQRIGTRIERLA